MGNLYGVSVDFLNKINDKYWGSVLYTFASNLNSNKIVLDSDNVILNIYKELGKDKCEIVNWLTVMSYSFDTSFEKVAYNVNGYEDEEAILRLVSLINCHPSLIVYSKIDFPYISDEDYSEFEGHKIRTLDRDEAAQALNVTNTYNNCQIATNGGNIKKSSINIK